MLSDATVRKAIRDARPRTLSDGSGRGSGRLILSIRNSRSGITAEWYAQQWASGARRLSKVGRYPDMSLADARQAFREQFSGAISSGADIRRAPAVKVATVTDLFDGYIASLETAGKRSALDARKTLRRVASLIGENRPAGSITTEDVLTAIRPTYQRGKVVMADAMRCYVHAAYQWAIRSVSDYRVSAGPSGYGVKANPAAGIPTEPKRPGQRWLTAEELGSFWRWLSEGGNPMPGKQATLRSNLVALQVIMTTGQRVEEIARIGAAMLDLEGATVDWEKTKNGTPHSIPLPSIALELLRSVTPNEHGLLFPSMAYSERPVHNQTLHKIVGRYLADTGADSFDPRDLRRTWKTLAGEAGISKEDRDRIQNHALGDVSSVSYDRYRYQREKRAAMDVWDRWFRQNVLK